MKHDVPHVSAAPLARLREYLVAQGLDGLIVPRTDVWQSEVTAPHDDCLAFISGFTGSAGMALVMRDHAQIYVDGRYLVQVREQVDPEAFDIRHLTETPPDRWLREHGEPGSRIGVNAMLVDANLYDKLDAACGAANAVLVPLPDDPFDTIWQDRPAPPLGKIRPMSPELAGETSASKRARIATELTEVRADLLVETSPDNIAWLLNLRGSDVPMNPLPQSFLLLDATGQVDWFVDRRKLGNDLSPFELPDVTLHEPADFLDRLAASTSGKSVLLDPEFVTAAVRRAITEAQGKVIARPDPITLAKAVKTDAELEGFRACHLSDGVALTEFLARLSAHFQVADPTPISELDAEEWLQANRAAQPGYLEDSFRAISASGANAAMCHYAAQQGSAADIDPSRPYLIDSGGQYVNGTTDATRTILLGAPDPALAGEIRRAYTAVLKGFLSLLSARFPTGTKCHQLDAFARRALWDLGLNYDHGTGHGVGHNLLIHEYPHRFAEEANPHDLVPGVVLTIEPGYYAAGRFGIRIENQVEVVEAEPGFCRFASLTLAPIDLSLVDAAALSASECACLDAYHAEVSEKLMPVVTPETQAWLADKTRPVAEQCAT